MKTDTSKVLLLDLNVLLAIAWPNHQFHRAAVKAVSPAHVRWATCAVTQLGFIRLSSNPSVMAAAKPPAEAAAMLRALVADPGHIYLKEAQPPAGPDFQSVCARLLGHRQVTDAYLLLLARQSGAIFTTFDKRLAGLAEPDTTVEVLGDPYSPSTL